MRHHDSVMSQRNRTGYAMLLVLAFIAAVFSIYSLSHRHLASLIRTEHTRALARERESGSVIALARACDLLETGVPPTDPYVCATTVQTGTVSQSFTIRFDISGTDEWTVVARPTHSGENPPPMPSTF